MADRIDEPAPAVALRAYHCITPTIAKVIRRLYREKLNLDMTPEQVIMFLVATDGVENLEQHGYSVAGDFLTATTA
ncbi:TPA: hypothetical protein MNH47_004596 [Klebsiella pneumoniae]|nr:hypothetical protein [Klebsiella pneumoniae]HCA0477258.1 hypothetical protein [Klebsiella pneumoniae]HCA0904322.1 hypothetical protein [Klebsiella pneumoniae]HCA1137293.1 hypothetical protein [Klebsiella pneumoniae]HCA1181442.1 hypothetical protein [Klebsiella pneumoniae]